MQDETNDSRTDPDAAALEAEVLIGRIIDDEATDEDRERFDRLATLEPAVWRRLAQRQADALHLVAAFDEHTARAVAVELPAGASPRRPGLMLAFSGWAAVLILAAVWVVTARVGVGFNDDEPGFTEIDGTPRDWTAERHLREYLVQPYVLGEFEPLVLEVEPLSDGRSAVRYLRRIEEVLILDENQYHEHIDGETGSLRHDPAAIRQAVDDADDTARQPQG